MALRAIADPTRRAILRLVGDDEMTAGQIASRFTASRPAISQHLRVLEEADLVTVRRDGTRRWYRAQPASLAEVRAYLDELWRFHLDELKRAAEQEEWPARVAARPRPARRGKGSAT